MIRNTTGQEFDATCVTVTVGHEIVPVLSIAYGDGNDVTMTLRMSRARVLLAHGALTGPLIVNYSCSAVGRDSDALFGFNVASARVNIDVPQGHRTDPRDRLLPLGRRLALAWNALCGDRSMNGILTALDALSAIEEVSHHRYDPAPLTMTIRGKCDHVRWTSRRLTLSDARAFADRTVS